MNNKPLASLLIALLFLGTSFAEPFQFQNDDVVVMLGNTFIERAQQSGHIETQLTLAAGDKKVKFRNLGWSGDTVYGAARSYFGPPQEGFDRLSKQIGELQPNVMFINYGAVAAFEGADGIAEFLKGYRRLLDMIYEKSVPREVVLISPAPAENLGAPLPDQTELNRNLALFRDAIQELAQSRNAHFLDLFSSIISDENLTTNGIHYSDEGYKHVAPVFTEALGLKPVESARLDDDAIERLRQKIIEKNRLYFHRWRPANETYLHLFRKHEQGQNARELPLFEPLVEAREIEIQVFKQLVFSK
ncbi:MAG: SGNH/GDSL hydrolase family protein [Verrucomicrobiota bacterium]